MLSVVLLQDQRREQVVLDMRSRLDWEEREREVGREREKKNTANPLFFSHLNFDLDLDKKKI